MTNEKVSIAELDNAVRVLTNGGFGAKELKRVINRMARKYVTLALAHTDESGVNADEDSEDLFSLLDIAERIEFAED